MNDKIQAELEPIRNLRQRLAGYAEQQESLLLRVQRTIDTTLEQLDQAERSWCYRLEQRRDELENCLQAQRWAEAGWWIDCDPCERLLHEAEEKLERIREVQYHTAQAIDQYHSIKLRLQTTLDQRLPNAITYLDKLITALEDVLAARVATVRPPPLQLLERQETQILFYDGSLPAPTPTPAVPLNPPTGFGNPDYSAPENPKKVA